MSFWTVLLAVSVAWTAHVPAVAADCYHLARQWETSGHVTDLQVGPNGTLYALIPEPSGISATIKKLTADGNLLFEFQVPEALAIAVGPDGQLFVLTWAGVTLFDDAGQPTVSWLYDSGDPLRGIAVGGDNLVRVLSKWTVRTYTAAGLELDERAVSGRGYFDISSDITGNCAVLWGGELAGARVLSPTGGSLWAINSPISDNHAEYGASAIAMSPQGHTILSYGDAPWAPAMLSFEEYDLSGTLVCQWTATEAPYMSALAVDDAGTIYAASDTKVYVYESGAPTPTGRATWGMVKARWRGDHP